MNFDWQACDSSVKICVSPAQWTDYFLQGLKKVWKLWFSIIPGKHPLIHFFLLLEASVPECFWQHSDHRLQQGDIMTPCPTVSPRVPFFVHLLVFLVEHGHWFPCFDVFPCTIHVLNTSNNGSMGFALQTTSKMISLSKNIFCGWLGPSWIFCEGNPCYKSSGTLIHPPNPPDEYTTACATC